MLVSMDANILDHVNECVTIYSLKKKCDALEFCIETSVPTGCGGNVLSLRGTEDWFCWFVETSTKKVCEVIDGAPMIETNPCVDDFTPTSSFYIGMDEKKFYAKHFATVGILLIRKSDGLYYIYAVIRSKKAKVELKLWRKPPTEGSSLACGQECVGEDAALTVCFEKCGFKTICLGTTNKAFCRLSTPPASCKKCKKGPCCCVQKPIFNPQPILAILGEWYVETKCSFMKAFDPGCDFVPFRLINYLFPCDCEETPKCDDKCCTIYTAAKGCDGVWIITHWEVEKCPITICATYNKKGCWSVSSFVYPICC